MSLVWGRINASFRTELFLMDFQRRMKKMVLIGFCQAAPSTKKENNSYRVQIYLSNIYYYFDMMMAALLKDTQREICARSGGHKKSISES